MQTPTTADRTWQDRFPPETLARECPRCGATHPLDAENSVRDPTALAQLRPKLADLGERIDDMHEDEYAGWLNALSFDEFLEFIVLDELCIAALMGDQTEHITAPLVPRETQT